MAIVHALQPLDEPRWKLTASAESRTDRVALRGIGARRKLTEPGRRWIAVLEHDRALADAVRDLDEHGFVFLDLPSGWPPAAVVALLRERGVLTGPPLSRCVGERVVRDL